MSLEKDLFRPLRLTSFRTLSTYLRFIFATTKVHGGVAERGIGMSSCVATVEVVVNSERRNLRSVQSPKGPSCVRYACRAFTREVFLLVFVVAVLVLEILSVWFLQSSCRVEAVRLERVVRDFESVLLFIAVLLVCLTIKWRKRVWVLIYVSVCAFLITRLFST